MKRVLIQGSSIVLGVVILFVILPWVAGDRSPFVSLDAIMAAWGSHHGDKILEAFGRTFVRFLTAMLLGGGLGILLGIFLSTSEIVRIAVTPWLDVLRVTPAIVWIPILAMMSTEEMRLVPYVPWILGVIYSALYIALDVQGKLVEIHPDEEAYLKAQRVRWILRVKFCYLPRVFAGAATGARLGGSIALILVVVGEALVYQPGLGHLIVSYMTGYDRGAMWASITLLGAFAWILFQMFSAIQRLAGEYGGD